MKKTFTVILLIGINLIAQSQEKLNFTFVKSSIIKLEYYANNSNDDIVSNPELMKRMQGIFLVADTLATNINYDTNSYIKLSSILSTEKFEQITFCDAYKNPEQNIFIQNVKTKKLYAIISYAFDRFQDYSNMNNRESGYGYIYKSCPKELSVSERETLTKYKALIKSANINILALSTIQKKYITKGRFDHGKVNSMDKNTFNKNILDLETKEQKLNDIYNYEDKGNQAEFMLTNTEIVTLGNIHTWVSQGKIY